MSLFTSKKKKYFLHKADGAQKMIWDLEFKRDKTLLIKEDVRREYDGACSKIHIIENRIKSQLQTPDKICEVHNPEKGKERVHKDKGKCVCEFIQTDFIGRDEYERLFDQVDLIGRDRDRYVAQMKQMEVDVHGTIPTNDYPDGFDGINQQLEALQELKGMLKEKIRSL